MKPRRQKKTRLRPGRRNWAVRLVVNANSGSKISDTVVTTATATNGSGIIFNPCLRRLCETAEMRPALIGRSASTKRHFASPCCLPEDHPKAADNQNRAEEDPPTRLFVEDGNCDGGREERLAAAQRPGAGDADTRDALVKSARAKSGCMEPLIK